MSQFHRYGLSRRWLLSDNVAPSDLYLDNDQVAENSALGTVIGKLTPVDPDVDLGDQFTYTLIDNAGGRFALDGNVLIAGFINLDFETQASWDVIIRVSDLADNFLDKTVTIHVLDGPEAPFLVQLSNHTIPEDMGVNVDFATITGLDPDFGDTLSFSLASDPDNKFQIINNTSLRLRNPVDFDTKSAHKLTIRATDRTGLVYDQSFTIDLTNVNEAPTDITLSNNQVLGGAAAGFTIGLLGTSDPDPSNTFSYLITADPNNKFQLSGNKLQVKSPPDYDVAQFHQVSIRSTDQGGLSVTKSFTIVVNQPVGVICSNLTMPENPLNATKVGQLSVVGGASGDSYTWSKIDDPNSMFFVNATTGVLQVANVANWNYELHPTTTVTVGATSALGNNLYQKTLTITLQNVNELPTGFSTFPSPCIIPETFAVGAQAVQIMPTDPDVGDTFSFVMTSNPEDKFYFVGDVLYLKNPLDWAVKNKHTIGFDIIDAGGLKRSSSLVVNVQQVWFAPTGINLSTTSIPENATTVGTLTPVDSNTGETGHTYAVTTDPSGKFSIANGNQLVVNAPINFEGGTTSFPIQVRITDPKGRGTFTKPFTITVTNVNEAPTAIGVALKATDTNSGAGSVVANLTAVDPDAGATFAYSIVTDPTGKMAITSTGATTANLTLTGKVATAGSYVIGLRVTDQGGLTFDTTTTVVVTQGSTYTIEATNLFAAMTSQPTDTRKTQIDNLIIALKAGGVWNCLDVLYVTAAHHVQAAKLNWKNPGSFTLVGNPSEPGFTIDRGFQGDGTSQRLDSGFNPLSTTGRLVAQNDAHAAAYGLATTTTQSALCGNGNLRVDGRTGAWQGRVNSTTTTSLGGTGGGGFGINARSNDSANVTGHFQSSTQNPALVGAASTSAAILNINFFLCGAGGTQYSAHLVKMGSLGKGVGLDFTAYYNAIQTYMAAVGAQS